MSRPGRPVGFLVPNKMQTLLDTVTWKASEHPATSRGTIASSGGFLIGSSERISPELVEECCVMTRRQAFVILNFSRTSVFQPDLPGKGGILWWRTSDEALLMRLHRAVVEICAEVGFSEFSVMCEARGPSAPYYWREMLGTQYRFLK